MSGVTVGRMRLSDKHVLPSVYGFCAVMAAYVADQRGGANMSYLHECYEFACEVWAGRSGPSSPVPADYDATVAGARDTALAMLEYDA